MIGDPEDRRYEIQGWLLDLVQQIEVEGSKAIAVAHVTEDGNLRTTWFDPSNCRFNLLAGTVLLQKRLAEN